MLRRKGFMIAVFASLGFLILYDALFFMNKKKAGAEVAPGAAAVTTSDPAMEEARAAAAKAAQAAQFVPGIRVDPPSFQADFLREPFLLPIEEREGKSLRQIQAEAEEEARRNVKKPEDPEVLKKLKALVLNGIVCVDRPGQETESPGSGVRRLALIGRELVSEGTVLPEIPATVVRITETAVELRAGDVTHVLKLAKLSPLGFEVK